MDFLNKKSWHPSKFSNVEKVWKVEQEAEAERRKMQELKRKLQEERQIEELRKVQNTGNLRSKYVLPPIDFNSISFPPCIAFDFIHVISLLTQHGPFLFFNLKLQATTGKARLDVRGSGFADPDLGR